ncbi:MAG: hypothetical protein ACYCV7_13300 [Acidimicrobiales bacterium]
MKRRKAAWIILAVGVGLIVAPEMFGMWMRAPRGAQMIQGFSTIMTAKNVPVIAGYGRTVLGGFGNASQVVQDAAHHYSAGHVTLSYQQASAFIQSRPDLSALAYLQRQLPTLGPPFSTLLSVFYQDQGYFAGMMGLPNFQLFPLFFLLPGILISVGAVRFLHQDGASDAEGRPVAAKGAAKFLAVIGLLLILAPLVPMPPGFHSIRTVGPHGATMLEDFAGPVNANSNQAIMSLATVDQFDRYVSEMRAAAAEFVPAIQDAGLAFAHRRVNSTDAASFLASDSSVTLANTLSTGFQPMYNLFHRMLSTMSLDIGDYHAVQALPSFALFPYFFIIPGVLVFGLAIGALLRGDPAFHDEDLPGEPPVRRAQRKVPALAGTEHGTGLAEPDP